MKNELTLQRSEQLTPRLNDGWWCNIKMTNTKLNIDVWGHNMTKDQTEHIAKSFILSMDFIEAAKEFVNRVEKGEVRSTYTYNKFKDLLDKIKHNG